MQGRRPVLQRLGLQYNLPNILFGPGWNAGKLRMSEAFPEPSGVRRTPPEIGGSGLNSGRLAAVIGARACRLHVKLSPSSVAVVVSNGKKALEFYHGKLGLDVLANEDHWLVVGRKKGGLALHLCAYGRPTPKSEKGNTGILLHTDKPMMQTYRELRKKGVKFSHPPQKVPWGWKCLLLDPDGNELWLAEED